MFAWLPPSSSDLAERKSVVPPSPPADRRREHRCAIARSARCDVRLVAALFVGSGRTEKRCSAITSCRSAARTSLCLLLAPLAAMFACSALFVGSGRTVKRCSAHRLLQIGRDIANRSRRRRRSRTEERVRSFLLTTAARETNARSSEYRHYPVSRADSSTGVTNRYPTLRTVPMTDSYSGPSLARSRRTCTSTVRVPP